MSTKRIKTGFHRIGVVLAAFLAVPGAGIGSWGVFVHDRDVVIFGMLLLAAGFACYLLAIAIGWIASGFAGDGESST
jgi:hypothetical protein